MHPGTRRFCVSLDAETVAEARSTVEALPSEVDLVELRLDRLPPEEEARGTWPSLAGTGGREWVFTWRSPREGGKRPRPPGVLARALAAGFAWIDVEAADLASGDEEARAVPSSRRWVSRHLPRSPETAAEVRAAWTDLARHEGALHKLVIPVSRFAENEWVLGLVDEVAPSRPVSIFGQGEVGHPSRVLGTLRGNAVTYLAGRAGRETAPGQPGVELALDVYGLARIGTDPALYGVLGHRVGASRSPHLHNRAFRARGWNALYMRLEAEDPGEVLRWVRQGGLGGVSVTAPFKESVVSMVDRLEPVAERIGAVNTIWREGNRLLGANTDVEAAVQMLSAFEGGEIAVLGAGGAARSVMEAARQLDRRVTMFHRDAARGPQVAREMGAGWGGSWSDLDPARFAVIVNATPVGGALPVPPDLVRRPWTGRGFLDLAYGAEPNAWETWVRAGEGAYAGGLEFLARQAVGQARRWMGEEVPLRLYLGRDA